MRRVATAATVLAVLVGWGQAGHAGDDSDHKDTVRIGLVGTLFRDVPAPLAAAMMHPFGALMQAQTGVAGDLVQGGDALHLASILADGQVQLAVFHGVEFAWARQQYPELQPLVLAVNQSHHLRAYVVVRADGGWSAFDELQGKAVEVPRQNREHCRLFLEQRCRVRGRGPSRFFSHVGTPANAEDALDDVVDRIAPAAVVDAVAWDCFQRRKPGRCDQLKRLEVSEVFPAAVVAYRPGVLDEDTLDQFREGLLGAGKNSLGRQFLMLWKLTAFEPVPGDYEECLRDIVKTYPRPNGRANPSSASPPPSLHSDAKHPIVPGGSPAAPASK